LAPNRPDRIGANTISFAVNAVIPKPPLPAIPAGALADILDRRRFLIIGEATAIATIFAVLVSLNLVTATFLLLSRS
jgi:hypothetical protein